MEGIIYFLKITSRFTPSVKKYFNTKSSLWEYVRYFFDEFFPEEIVKRYLSRKEISRVWRNSIFVWTIDLSKSKFHHSIFKERFTPVEKPLRHLLTEFRRKLDYDSPHTCPR